MKILIGTSNPAKFNRYRMVLQRFEDLEVLSLKDISKDLLPIIEDGSTAEENARKKARIYSTSTKIRTLSVDEALFIKGLPNHQQPGVYVRRFDSERPLTDEEMLEKFLSKTANLSDAEREVLWIYAICLATPDGKEFFGQVELKEMLSDTPKLPIIRGYPLSSLLYDPLLKKYQSEYSDQDWFNYLNPVYVEIEKIIQNSL